MAGNRISMAQDFLRDAMEAGNILGDLSNTIVQLKPQLSPDGQLRAGKALGYLGTAQRHLAQAKAEVRMAVQLREEAPDLTRGQVCVWCGSLPGHGHNVFYHQKVGLSEGLSRMDEQAGEIKLTAIEFGYSQNLAAPPREVWYAHPVGTHLRTFQFGEGLGWELYQAGKSTERGFGPTSLRERFAKVHRDLVQEGLSTAPKVLDRSPGLRTREDQEYLIRMTSAKPVERFEVRPAGGVYPTYVSFDPKDGRWMDYQTGEQDSRTIALVQRWKKLGSPSINIGGDGRPASDPSTFTRTGAAMETPDQFTGYEHTVNGRGRRPYGYNEKNGVVPD